MEFIFDKPSVSSLPVAVGRAELGEQSGQDCVSSENPDVQQLSGAVEEGSVPGDNTHGRHSLVSRSLRHGSLQKYSLGMSPGGCVLHGTGRSSEASFCKAYRNHRTLGPCCLRLLEHEAA